MNTQLLWQVRRRITAQLESAPPEKQAGLRASLRGIDLVLRTLMARGSNLLALR